MERAFNVLFLCTGNSARSIMAEAILRREGKGLFNAYSAGSHPKGSVNAHALRLLNELDHGTAFARSKSWDEFASAGSPVMDFVFTVCDSAGAETCPIWPGRPATAHWGIPDPAAVGDGDAERAIAFADAYCMLHARISSFVNLPIASLDRMSLQHRLEAIGQGQ